MKPFVSSHLNMVRIPPPTLTTECSRFININCPVTVFGFPKGTKSLLYPEHLSPSLPGMRYNSESQG